MVSDFPSEADSCTILLSVSELKLDFSSDSWTFKFSPPAPDSCIVSESLLSAGVDLLSAIDSCTETVVISAFCAWSITVAVKGFWNNRKMVLNCNKLNLNWTDWVPQRKITLIRKYLPPFSKGANIKERICSPWEQILFFIVAPF